jgi:AraC-like DNA-binding protein
MHSKASVSVTLVETVFLYARDIGIDVTDLKKRVGQTPDSVERVPARLFYRLWCEIVRHSGDPDFGLHLVEGSRSLWSGDILSAVMLNSPTVGDAMARLCRYHALVTDVVQIDYHQDGIQASYAWHSALPAMPGDRQISEAVICQLFYALTKLSGEAMPFVAIHFKHPAPVKISEHKRIFNIPVLFNQPEDEIVVQQVGLVLSLPLANPTMLVHLEALAQSLLDALYAPESWADRVTKALSKRLLEGGKLSISFVAGQFAMSPRYLQTKLKKEGVTYRILLDQVRQQMALGYLREPGINMYDTAFLLGYSDQSAFNHAFKRWTGLTPGEFRSKINKNLSVKSLPTNLRKDTK